MADEWFYVVDKKKQGPVTFAQLQQMAASGQLQSTDMVLEGGTAKWAAAESVTGLFQPSADYLPDAPTEQEMEDTRAGFADIVDTAPPRIKPHQGSLVMLMGGLGLASALIGLFGQCCSFMLVKGMFQVLIPFPVIGLGLGGTAFWKGGQHLHLMKIMHMDPQGEGQTRMGWTLGIAATVLGIIGIIMYLTIVIIEGMKPATN